MSGWVKKKQLKHMLKVTFIKSFLKLEKDISEALGAKTKITQSTKGGGRIVINFSSLGALQGILEKIKD